MDPRSPVRVLVVVALAASAAACSGTAGPGPGATAERVRAVRDARAAVAGPAEQLGAAVLGFRSDLDAVQQELGEPAITALDEAVGEVDTAAADLEDTDLAGDTRDVRAAVAAVGEAVTEADELVAAGQVVVEAARQLARVDAELQALARSWEQAGSRSEVLARLEETATAAEALAEEEPPARCRGPMQVRHAAAEFVATSSRDLRALASSRDGAAFDARLAELEEAPYGHTATGEQPRALPGLEDPADCPALAAATAAAVDVEEALQALEDALNPSDLAS